jgi:hypothetical protein
VTKRIRILLVVIAAPIALAIAGLIALVLYVRLTRPPDEWGWLEEYSVEQEVFTAKEAYALVRPLVHEWHEDAVISSASAGNLWSDLPEWTVRPDGRNAMWHFIACSEAAGKWVSVMVVRGSVGLGVYDKPWGSIDNGCSQPLPFDELIDSDVAIRTATCLANGLKPRGARIAAIDQFTHQRIPYSWLIDFAPPGGGILYVYIDGTSGRPIHVVRDSETTIPLDELPPC